MKTLYTFLVILGVGAATCAGRPYAEQVDPQLTNALNQIANSEKAIGIVIRNASFKPDLALLLFSLDRDNKKANQLVLEFCRADRTKYTGEGLFRIYLKEQTRERLSPAAHVAIEDYAWDLLKAFSGQFKLQDADESVWASLHGSENIYLNTHQRFWMALKVVNRSAKYGPQAQLDGSPIAQHVTAWDGFWKRYFRDRVMQGSTDFEMAQPSSYGKASIGAYYDLYDAADDAGLRELAGKFLTLYWAEVASEFEPKTGQRALASSRNYFVMGERQYWAKFLLHAYGWHDDDGHTELDHVLFLTSSYRPPEILRAIAANKNRGCYLMTSRRAGLEDATDHHIIFDQNGDSDLRRDVYYTPDYTLSTIAYAPDRDYNNTVNLEQGMGATFASGEPIRLAVKGKGYGGSKGSLNGITGSAVSIVARNLKAEFGEGRFQSSGMRVYLSKDDLWKNHVEDASGWLFTCSGNAYAAVRVAGEGYTVSDEDLVRVNRKNVLQKNEHGVFLDFKDMWAPVVIQMGRAADYKSFEAFQAAVKARKFEYENGKLIYESEAKDTYEYWAKGAQLPKINGATVNLNPPKTYDSPYLSMEHGSNKAVIKYPGYDDVVLEF